jgi:PAS domain-containing protein/CheY-like chemotaxis protein
MNDLLLLDLLPILFIAAAIILVIYFRSHPRQKVSPIEDGVDSIGEKFRKIFFSTLSEVILSSDLAKSFSAIANGMMQSLDASVFVFRRNDESASLICYAANDLDRISSVLVKLGIRLDVNAVPLRGGRVKVFAGGYAEFEDPFALIGDLATSAACRKIQNELKFSAISTISVKTESGDYLILALLPFKFSAARNFIGQFGTLLTYAVYISNLKKKLFDFQQRFDEQFVKMKNEFLEKEGAHLQLYDEMPVPAAILDESGVITEANRALGDLFGGKSEAIGQPFSSIMEEETRQNFVELLLNLKIRTEDNFSVVVSKKYFKVRLVYSAEKNQIAAYLFDETAGVNLRAELERTIDALRKENELAEKLIAAEKKHSTDIILNSATPAMAVRGDMIEFASESAKKVFSIAPGQSVMEFSGLNEVSGFSEFDPVFETDTSGGRSFSVSQWESGEYRYYLFTEITEARKVQEELRKYSIEFEKLFDSAVPTARVKANEIIEWNNAFESLMKDVLATEKRFDGFLRYLSESPEAIKSELLSNKIVKRTCRTIDRKSLNVCLTPVEDSVFVSIEDITEQENLRQELRNTQSLLSNSIEFFSDEPMFVLENGVVSAANLAARDKLVMKIGEAFNLESLYAKIGASDGNNPVEINGRFFRIENKTIDNSTVFHFREVSEELTQRAEIDMLKHRQDLLRELANSEQYENILVDLKEMLVNSISLKSICTGILYSAKESADVYLQTVSMDKIEPSLSLSLNQVDVSFVEHGGVFSKIELPDTTFSNIISSGGSKLLIESTSVGDVHGFASVALADLSFSGPRGQEGLDEGELLDEISKILKVASSTAVDIHTRSSAQKKFEESGKVTRALVGLTGISDGSFSEISRKTADLLKQVFGADSAGIYSIDGPALSLLAVNGSLPDTVSVPSVKFGTMIPASQLAADQTIGNGTGIISPDGICFLLKSRQQNLALVFKFTGVPPTPSELNAVSSIALDLLELKKATEAHARIASGISDESKSMNDFIAGISKASDPQEVLRILRDTLLQRNKDSTVSASTDENSRSSAKPLEMASREEGSTTVFEINFLDFGIGNIIIRVFTDSLSRTMVDLAVNKIRSLLALGLPMAQHEAADLKVQLEKVKGDLASLRDSVDKIPATLRNARIGIDGALSRLSFVQGDEKIIQEIRMGLASAAKEFSTDFESIYLDQEVIFKNVGLAVMAHETAAAKIHNFDVSALTEFRVERSIAELIRDIFVNFITASEVPDSEVLMMTSQPSPNELAAGKGKHISIRLTAREGATLHEDKVKSSASLMILVNKIEKMGYEVDARAHDNELIMDICEIKKPDTTKGMTAILVEDDRALLEEESQNILQIFSHLKVAGDAVEAAKIIGSEKFAVAFVDLSLPSINGKELCQQIKTSQPECTTVLLTNREGEEKSSGVDHIILRPMTQEVIRNLIKK